MGVLIGVSKLCRLTVTRCVMRRSFQLPAEFREGFLNVLHLAHFFAQLSRYGQVLSGEEQGGLSLDAPMEGCRAGPYQMASAMR